MNPDELDDLDDYYTGPSVDPMEHAMVEHLVEFETEMFLDCRQGISKLSYKELGDIIDLHGEDWQNAVKHVM